MQPFLSCENCGRHLSPEENYCGNCGTAAKTLISGGPTNASPPSQHSRNPSTQFASKRSKSTQKVPAYVSAPTKSVVAKKKSRALWAAIIWVIRREKFWPTVVTLVIVFGIYGVINAHAYRDSPGYELQTYCNELKGVPSYDAAYGELSSRETAKSSITKDQFIARVKAIADPRDGIGDCTVNIVSQFGDIAHGTVTYTFGNGSKSTEQYEVFRVGYQDWKIETRNWQPDTAPVA